jgi:hypothetical protein
MVWIILSVIVYIFPTIVAYTRRLGAGWGLLAVLNLLIGWTGIGWLACIWWAAFGETKTELDYYTRAGRYT